MRSHGAAAAAPEAARERPSSDARYVGSQDCMMKKPQLMHACTYAKHASCGASVARGRGGFLGFSLCFFFVLFFFF